MKIALLLFPVFLFFGQSCKKENEPSQEEDTLQLTAKYRAVLSMAGNTSCTDASNWAVVALGAKACGGPQYYIPYSKSIDQITFLKKVAALSQFENEYNKRWGIFSDCAISPVPKGVECENGTPKLTYE